MGLFDIFFGGGGGDGGMGAYLAFQRGQQQKVELEAERQETLSRATTDLRRNTLADRRGYGGSVNVGSAAPNLTDRTLRARMLALPPEDPQRVAYEAAQEREASLTAEHRRIQTGEEFKVVDRLSTITTELGKLRDKGFRSDKEINAVQGLLDRLTALQGERAGRYAGREDVTTLRTTLEQRLKRARSRPVSVPNDPSQGL